jgi:DNA-directed RNA polymerase subunit K/omega
MKDGLTEAPPSTPLEVRRQMRLRSAPQADKETQVIDRLSKRYGRYALVVGITKRALDLRDRVDSQLEPNEGALIRRAIDEIAGGRVQVQSERTEDESE